MIPRDALNAMHAAHARRYADAVPGTSRKLVTGIRMNSPRRLVRFALQGMPSRYWYDHAASAINDVAARRGWCAERFADVIAIMSPRTAVTRNIRIAIAYMTAQALPADVIRSTRAALDNYEAGRGIAGPKTSQFAAALRGDTSAVVVDVHMARALGIRQTQLSRVAVRDSAQRRIRYAAALARMEPARFQAACWAGYLAHIGRRNIPTLHEELARHAG